MFNRVKKSDCFLKMHELKKDLMEKLGILQRRARDDFELLYNIINEQDIRIKKEMKSQNLIAILVKKFIKNRLYHQNKLYSAINGYINAREKREKLKQIKWHDHRSNEANKEINEAKRRHEKAMRKSKAKVFSIFLDWFRDELWKEVEEEYERWLKRAR